MKLKLAESIFFNYFGAIAGALGPLLAIPVYLAVLGKAQWGMMSVVMTFMAFLTMLDGGLSQVLLREFAVRAQESGLRSQRVQSLLASFQLVYALLGLVLAAGLAWSSEWIAGRWLNLAADMDTQEAAQLLLMGAGLVAIQLCASLPRSLLQAVELHAQLNLSIAMAHLCRYGLGALLVWLSHSLQWLLVWYVVVALAEGGARYAMAWQAVGPRDRHTGVSWSDLRQLLPDAAKMSLAVILSGLTTQMDKLILSKMVALDQLGIYAIASSVALGILSFTYPLIQAVFPTLVASRENTPRLRKIFLAWLATAAAGAALAMGLYMWLGNAVLELWLRNVEVSAAVYPVLMFLLIGTALNVIYQVGYVGWMMDANYKMPLVINACSVALMLVLVPALVAAHGIVGASAGWLLINALGLVLSLSWFRKFF